MRRIVADRLGGTAQAVSRLTGGYSGGSLFRVHALFDKTERTVVVKIGKVTGLQHIPDDAPLQRVYGARSWSHAPTHALLRARGLPVYDLLAQDFPSDAVPYFWVAMSLLEGIDVRGHGESDPNVYTAFHHCCGEALGALHAVTRPHDGPVDRDAPFRTSWTTSFFASLEEEIRNATALGSPIVTERARELHRWLDERRRRWVEPALYSLSQMDGLQGIARHQAHRWRFQGHVDLEDFSFMDARFPLAGFEIGAEGLRGLKPIPESFYDGYRSHFPIDPSFAEARDVFKLYYLLSWLYIPYDPRYHASPEEQRQSIDRHETAILALIRGDRRPA